MTQNQYATSEYYLGTYQGTVIKPEDLDRALSRASDEIDSLTYNRIRAKGFDNLTEFQQEKVRQAACIQADFQAQYGEFLSNPLGAFSAGSISVNFREKVNGVAASSEALRLLGQTGLTSRRL